VIDVDNHYDEVDDAYSRHIEYRDQSFVRRPVDGGFRVRTMGDRLSHFLAPGIPQDVINPPGFWVEILNGEKERAGVVGARETLEHTADHPEWRERDARLKTMDDQGIDIAFMLPTVGVVPGDDFRNRPDVLCANYRSFNRWQEEDWGYAPAGRTVAAPVLTLIDLDWAVAELERVAALGRQFIILPTGPVNGRSPADPIFNPFWARLAETGMKLIYHVDQDPLLRIYAGQWSEDPTHSSNRFSAFQHYVAFVERQVTDTMAALLLHNLFGRFPALEVITIELGSVWIPNFFRQVDKAAKLGAHTEWLGRRLKDKPSETIRRHGHINPFHEEDIAWG
jgi:predicted TIM-barrel fold metal-dependent hydrolase